MWDDGASEFERDNFYFFRKITRHQILGRSSRIRFVICIALLAVVGMQFHNGVFFRYSEPYEQIPVERLQATQRLLQAKEWRKNSSNYMRACMIVKNDNHMLAQWIAYHYTVLPLRHFIVATDTNYTEDPMDVLSRWNGTDLKYEVWYPENYTKGLNYVGNEKARYLQRQLRVFAACMKYLHRQGDLGWVALVDTDEYIKLNPLDDFLAKKFYNNNSLAALGEIEQEGALPHIGPNETLLDRVMARMQLRKTLGLEQANQSALAMQLQQHLHQRLHSHPTVLDFLEEYSSKHGTLPCHSMARRQYSLVVDNFTELANTICQPILDPKIQENFNTSLFKTVQFLYHGYPLTFTHNEWAKVVVDLRRIPYDKLSRAEPIGQPHSPLDECPCPYMPDIASIIHANHYGSHWSDHMARRGSNVESNISKEMEHWSQTIHLRDHVRCDHIHGWFNDFVDEFGMDKAKFMLREYTFDGNTRSSMF